MEPIVEVSWKDFEVAADLAEMAEAVAFSGNDVAALRNGIAGDSEIQMFVDYVASLRLASPPDLKADNAALREALRACQRDVCGEYCSPPYHVDSCRNATAALQANEPRP